MTFLALASFVSLLGVAHAGTPCDHALSPDLTFAREVTRLFIAGQPRDESVAGLVALSRHDLEHLLSAGELEPVAARPFFPFRGNERVKRHLEAHPELAEDAAEPGPQARRAAAHAWALTMADLFFARITAAFVRPQLDADQMRDALFLLRPEAEDAAPYFSPSLDDLEDLPEVIDVPTPPPQPLPAGTRLDRDLARRVNVGPDLADLNRWSALRTVAEMFAVSWSGEPHGPSLERALKAYFARRPREAGVVVSLRASALDRVTWRAGEAPSLGLVSLGDLAGLHTLGREERALLARLLTPRRAADKS